MEDYPILSTLVVIYFIPVIVARLRSHHNTFAIGILNLVAGWTLVGWIAALVWAFTRPPEAEPRVTWHERKEPRL
ncbi:superinfection immunity protein [Thioalkalivibrio paradoxus]|uniref:Membrane protein n=1 Tax=Thioalkalivibrio paradoxus ARh 1 TaxID=713585 RepID=W0DQV9_9GAMM|nr:superinfection immunity protein [Thioalkalivibrio paradoxus]AHE99378.1 membrane protein [Thioalkalivibrio paradoxus ARh 1]